MLIDDFLPEFDVSERHLVLVRAPAARVYAAIRTADLAGSPVVRALFAARALPAILRAPRAGLRRLGEHVGQPLTLRGLESAGFCLLAEAPPRELLLGLVGRFWTLRGGLLPTDAARFRSAGTPGTARAAWSFQVRALPDGRCELSTDTRVACADPASRRRFRLYWLVVRPWSGLIRRFMLRAIRQAAEREGG